MPSRYIPRERANAWTQGQKDLMEQLVSAGIRWPEIAARCGHPKSSCQTMLSNIRRERRKAGDDTTPTLRKSFTRYVAPPPEPVAPPSARRRHTATLVADAELRARIEILGPTGGLQGDPLPGRSALDQLRASQANAPMQRPTLPRRSSIDQTRNSLA